MSVGYPPEKGGGRDDTDNETQAEDRSDHGGHEWN